MSRPSDVVVVDPQHPDPAVLERAGELLRSGRLVAFPTETVYGLGADARDADAVRAVFEGKGRPATDPLIVHVASPAAVAGVVASWPEVADRLAEAFWPGPLTMVLPRSADLPAEIAAGRDTVAVRVPAHPVALGLLSAAGVPVAAPSANRFGRVSPTSARHVEDELRGVYDLLIDAGSTPLGVESTVVDLTGDRPEVLRPGGVPLELLAEVVGEVRHRERTVVPEDESTSSPGAFLRHYAPLTPLVLLEGGAQLARRLTSALAERGVVAGTLELPPDASDAARELYAALREADGSGAAVILARTVDPSGLGRAVNDRLYRAAHGRVVLDGSPVSVERIATVAVPRPTGDGSAPHQ